MSGANPIGPFDDPINILAAVWILLGLGSAAVSAYSYVGSIPK